MVTCLYFSFEFVYMSFISFGNLSVQAGMDVFVMELTYFYIP